MSLDWIYDFIKLPYPSKEGYTESGMKIKKEFAIHLFLIIVYSVLYYYKKVYSDIINFRIYLFIYSFQ